MTEVEPGVIAGNDRRESLAAEDPSGRVADAAAEPFVRIVGLEATGRPVALVAERIVAPRADTHWIVAAAARSAGRDRATVRRRSRVAQVVSRPVVVRRPLPASPCDVLRRRTNVGAGWTEAGSTRVSHATLAPHHPRTERVAEGAGARAELGTLARFTGLARRATPSTRSTVRRVAREVDAGVSPSGRAPREIDAAVRHAAPVGADQAGAAYRSARSTIPRIGLRIGTRSTATELGRLAEDDARRCFAHRSLGARISAGPAVGRARRQVRAGSVTTRGFPIGARRHLTLRLCIDDAGFDGDDTGSAVRQRLRRASNRHPAGMKRHRKDERRDHASSNPYLGAHT
jgi:hypothetical protein